MIRVFIGYDPVEAGTFYTLAHSIHTRCSQPVSITPVSLENLRGVLTRGRDPLQSNDFSFSRFLVPWMCDFEGWAIFMDCDMLVQDDIAKLWALRDDKHTIKVVKHNHIPQESTKYLGNKQTQYNRKNWSSVMLMNCAKCEMLTPDYVNHMSGLQLHQFKWLFETSVNCPSTGTTLSVMTNITRGYPIFITPLVGRTSRLTVNAITTSSGLMNKRP